MATLFGITGNGGGPAGTKIEFDHKKKLQKANIRVCKNQNKELQFGGGLGSLRDRERERGKYGWEKK